VYVGLLAAALFINYVDRGAVPTAAILSRTSSDFPRANWAVVLAFFWSYYPVADPGRVGGRALWAQRVWRGAPVWACATMLVARAVLRRPAVAGLLLASAKAPAPCCFEIARNVVPVRAWAR